MPPKRATAVAEGSHREPSATGSVAGENSADTVRNAGESTTPSERQHTPQPPSAEEALEAEHARLTILVKNQRRQGEIDEMKKELAGETPGFRATVNGVTPETRHKRHASLLEADSFKRQQTRPKEPPSYEGKHMKELHDYELGWKLHWEAMPAQADSQRIAFAATYLKGGPRDSWGRRTETPETWEDYVIWLRRQLADPANRMAYASLKLKNSQQRKGQTIRDFASYLDELDDDLPEMTREERRAWELLNGLQFEIRREIMRENKAITSREQVITAGQRQEELARQQNRSHEPASYAPANNKRFTSERRATTYVKDYKGPTNSANRSSSSTSTNRPSSNVSRNRSSSYKNKDKKPASQGGVKCYNCQEMGHISKDCPTPKTGEGKVKKEKA